MASIIEQICDSSDSDSDSAIFGIMLRCIKVNIKSSLNLYYLNVMLYNQLQEQRLINGISKG